MIAGKKLAAWLIGLIFIGTLVWQGYNRYRSNQIDALYQAANNPFGGEQAMLDATRDLGKIQDPQATQYLITLATGDSGLDWNGNQRGAALEALADRDDPEIGEALAARLLQLHKSMYTRLQAAETLKKIACSPQCVSSVLHYLERVAAGVEIDYERRFVAPDPAFQQDQIETWEQDRQHLQELLYEALQKEPYSPQQVLWEEYGVGSSAPPTFGITIIRDAQLTATCSLLLQTERQIPDYPDEYIAPRQELAEALEKLRCGN